MMKAVFGLVIGLSLISGFSYGQTKAQIDAAEKARLEQEEQQRQLDQRRRQLIREAEMVGIDTELAAIGGFRGARSNTIMGYGLVVGLNGTGDSKQISATSTAMSNALSRWGTLVAPDGFKAKNIAIVSVTCEMPAFAAPGRKMDVTVQSLGDAKSLEGGFLLPTPLAPAWDATKIFAQASGGVSIGGYNAGASGSSVRKNHPTAGRVPDGASVEKSVPTQVVFDGNVVYFDLDTPDFTTAKRVAVKIGQAYPNFVAVAEDGVTVKVVLPVGADPVTSLSQIEKLEVYANTPPTVVINERTGTIVVGGNVKLGPALIAHGSLRVRIDTEFMVSQPAPLSNGTTQVIPRSTLTADEDPPQVTVVSPNASLDDLARIFQTLNLTARDIIAILQALSEQGALKARIKIQ